MLAFYLHHLSPYIFRFSDKVALHWYGLAYVAGFYCAYLVMHSFAKRGYGEIKPDKVADFITFAALFGVVVGGRLGYMLLYNLDEFIHDPGIIVKLWDGGMASHGGIAGLAIYTMIYGWRNKLSWVGLADNLVVSGTIGLFFGRIANFINGELFGRITNVPWAVKFPTEVHHSGFVPAVATDLNYQALPHHSHEIIAAMSQVPGGLQELESILNPRHPSQIYEALLEGLFLFVVLYFVRTRSKHLPNGLVTALFFLLYAAVRIFGENFREPDSGANPIMGMTHGQFYSTFMIGAGLAFLAYAGLAGRHQSKAV
ncbi:MAG: prolipoprotein diacylglyceryl transferase [Verrucomicrobiaceae bacterium]